MTEEGGTGNGNVVRVSLRDIYAAQQDLQKSMDTLHADMRVHLSLAAHPAAVAFMADHEARVRVIESGSVPASRLATKQLEALSEQLDGVKKRIWMALGGVTVAIFAINIYIAITH